MKEDKAKTKICPFMSHIQMDTDIFTSFDRTALKCIGGECMAWVWNDEEINPTEQDLIDAKEMGYLYWGYKKSETDGYCIRLGAE